MGHARSLSDLKKRLQRKVGPKFGEIPTTIDVLEYAEPSEGEDPRIWMLAYEVLRLRGILKGLQEESISCDDARDFTLGVQDQLTDEVRTWGDDAMSAEAYMQAQKEAEERAKDEAEFERLRKKLGK